MNKRTKTLIILIYGLIIAGLFARQGPLLVAAIPFVIYLAVGLVFAPGKPSLQAERVLSADRVNQNNPIIVQLKITNQGSPIENIFIEDIIPPNLKIIAGSPKMITTLKSGQTASFSYTITGKRGQYRLPGLKITTSDYLGLIPKNEILALSNPFLILPDTYNLPNITIRPRRTRVLPGLIPARKGGAGVEFFGLREYQSGDPMRWINDRVSARHEQNLFVNEFEQERAVDIGLILDCRSETNLFQENAELFEYGTQAAATLADSFLKYGNRVGLLIYGGMRNWVHPGYGKVQKERIFQALATVRLHERVVSKELSNIPTRLFPARSQLVLISSLQYQDLPALIALRAQGYRLLIISPDPIAFESKLITTSPTTEQAVRIARLERDFLLRQIRRTGTRVLDWPVNQPFYQIARTALTRETLWGIRQGGVYA